MFVDFLRKTAKELNTIATLIEKAPEILKTLDKEPTVPQVSESEPVSQDVLDLPENAVAATPEPVVEPAPKPLTKSEPKKKPGRKSRFASPAEKLAYEREYRRKYAEAHKEELKAKQAEYRAQRKKEREARQELNEAWRKEPPTAYVEPTAPEIISGFKDRGQLRLFHETLHKTKNVGDTLVELYGLKNRGTISLVAAELKSHPDRYALIYRGHGIIDTNEKLLDELDPA